MTIFFDLDGPILDVSERYHSLHSDLLGVKNFKPLSKTEYWDLKRGKIPEKEILTKTNAQGIYSWYQEERLRLIETSDYLKLDRLTPKATDILKSLSATQQLVLVTLRSDRNQLLRELEAFDIIHYFKAILSAPGNSTPKWSIKYQLIMNHMGTLEKDSVIIGDTETDVQAGQNLGIKTIAVLNGIRNREILQQFSPGQLINDISELSTIKF